MMIIEGDVTAPYRWTVYGLADSGRPDDFFYIGMSRLVSQRLRAHRSADTLAGRRCREIEASGGTVLMSYFLETDDWRNARRREIEEIVRRPKVLNLLRTPKEATRQVAVTLPISLIRLLKVERERLSARSLSAAIRALLERGLK